MYVHCHYEEKNTLRHSFHKACHPACEMMHCSLQQQDKVEGLAHRLGYPNKLALGCWAEETKQA